MRIHRFYIPEQLPTSGSYTVLDERLIHQWKHVFRYASGDEIVLFNGRGTEVRCQFDLLSKEKAVVSIIELLPGGWIPQREVWLYAALIKKDKFEWLAEKCTELGVTKIVPVVAERTIKKDINLDRLTAIVIEAAEQSERGTVPHISEPLTLADALAEAQAAQIVIANRSGAELSLNAAKPVALFIGPEGGWSPTEEAFFSEQHLATLSLGVQNLKAETAAIVGVAMLINTP
jgi:16S rRNA (uracil1498-N3)-methyltransferase